MVPFILHRIRSRSAMIRKIALEAARGDMWPKAAEKGASLFVTADTSYHNRQDALNCGLKL